MPSSNQQHSRRRGHQTTSSNRGMSNSDAEELLSENVAQKNIVNVLISAIDDIAKTLEQIPHSDSTSAPSKSSSRSTLGEKVKKKRRERNGFGMSSSSSSKQHQQPESSWSATQKSASEILSSSCSSSNQYRTLSHPTTFSSSDTMSSSCSSDAEELLSPNEARKVLMNLLVSAIDDVAETLKQIPRADSADVESELVPIDVTPSRSTLGEKVKKKRRERNGFGMSSSPPSKQHQQPKSSCGIKRVETVASEISISSTGSSNKCSECGCECLLDMPKTHGVFQNKLIYCHDRYFMCNGKNMYTRQIYAGSNEILKADYQKLNKLRGLKSDTTPSTAAATAPSSIPSTPNTIVIQNIDKNAKGITLQFAVKLIKPDGTPKTIDLAIEMPDFEPSAVRVGEKIAFFE